MSIKEENNFGQINISETVLKNIAYKSLEKFLKEEKIYNLKIEKDLPKNIKIGKNEDQSITVTVKTAAKYGENIVEFSKKLQELIKNELEKMADVYVTNIEVIVESLEYPITEELEQSIIETKEYEEKTEE
ncbi:hypothetical protein OSSY52_20000 [Tepiditoga spiralis]|uniref:Alkaline-shock protein n=1 Tax=Tepiditoga spiralis TaxID=2108365 RepID=A0A7G1GC72_9BACT|nr:Asp23/Gls24 family envelope stress response protein [Tepiditoga spiralis]BBE31859.1 hypothetical protein OSSY52_20000 [Tepiditoga spiralis]